MLFVALSDLHTTWSSSDDQPDWNKQRKHFCLHSASLAVNIQTYSWPFSRRKKNLIIYLSCEKHTKDSKHLHTKPQPWPVLHICMLFMMEQICLLLQKYFFFIPLLPHQRDAGNDLFQCQLSILVSRAYLGCATWLVHRAQIKTKDSPRGDGALACSGVHFHYR